MYFHNFLRKNVQNVMAQVESFAIIAMVLGKFFQEPQFTEEQALFNVIYA